MYCWLILIFIRYVFFFFSIDLYQISVVEMLPQILGPLDSEMAAILQKDLERRGVSVITGDAIAEFAEAPNDVDSTIVKLKSGKTLPPAHMVILGLGVRPDSKVGPCRVGIVLRSTGWFR